ncbi:MAG: leukotoxin LktA family filamentous adhesin, partial [Endomicrobium sp.]|nr:leukotoxin LktA family filamentous adhesin [Endomicrobium sp.]
MKKKIVSLITAVLFAVSQSGFAQMIVIDGKTDTLLETNGNVTDIKTNTVSGNTGFNSFKQFDVYLDNTVNLHLQNGINNLVNLVRGKATSIDGVLNAFKDGKIGGNVFFLNPNGIMIGQSGVVNVGALMLATPTKEFMDSIINEDKSVSSLITKAILAGDMPVNPSGTISIKGKINAQNGAGIKAGNAEIAHSGEINSVKPSDIANLSGIEETEIYIKDGQIIIDSKSNFINEGKIDAQGSDISITAANDIELKNGSVISSNGTRQENGGNIFIWADNDAYLRNGALVSATAEYGGGGFIEFSAKNNVFLEGWGLAAYSLYGKGGTVLIDPNDLTILASTDTLGANYYFTAYDTITVSSGVNITTSKTGADSGNILFSAENIDIENDVVLDVSAKGTNNAGNINIHADKDLNIGDKSVINASAVNGNGGNISLQGEDIVIGENVSIDSSGATSGDVLIEALASSQTPWFKTAEASIEIGDGTSIKGKDITIHAKADSALDFQSKPNAVEDTWETEDSPSDVMDAVSDNWGDVIKDLALNVSEVVVDAIDNFGLVGMGAKHDLSASVKIGENVNIAASNNLDIKSEVDSQLKLTVPFTNLAVAVGIANTNSLVEISQNAVLTAGNNLNIKAYTNTLLDVNAKAISNASVGFAGMDGAFALGIMKGNNKVKINENAQLTSGADMEIEALTDKDIKVDSSASAFDDGNLAFSGAVSLSEINNETDVNAKLSAGKDASISSIINSANNRSTSSAGTGDNKVTYYVNKAANFAAQKSGIAKLFGKGGDKFQQKSHSSFGAAGSVAYSEHTNNAIAKVGSSADITAGADADLTGNFTLKAQITENRIRHASNASVSSINKGESGYTKENGGAAAVAISEYNNNVSAYIDDNAQVDSDGDISVSSNFLLPYEITWHKIEGLSDITQKLNGNLGLQNGFVNTWANSTVSTNQENSDEQGNFGFAASFNMTAFNSTSKAYIGKNAKINQRTTLPGDVSVNAYSLLQTVNVAGNIGASSAKAGVGAGMVWVNYDNKTESYIDDGAQIKASLLNVEAQTEKRDITIAISGNKKAESFGFNGVFNWIENVNVTLAHISGSSKLDLINSGVLNLSALDDTQIYNISGGILKVSGGKNVGVGAAAALIDSEREVKAYIGEDEEEETSTPTETNIEAGDINVKASTQGDIYAFSVAASVQAGQSAKEAQSQEDLAAENGQDAKGGGGGFGLGISGDVSITNSKADTKAFINGANIKSGDIEINAKDETNITTASGSAAIMFSSESQTSVGIAGSASVNTISNNIEAFVKKATINASKLNLSAKNDSYILSVSASGSAAPMSKNGISVAGAVSINEIENNTAAYSDNSTVVLSSPAASNIMSVSAKDASEILAIAGGISSAKTVGIGAAVGVNNINNSVKSYINGGQITAYGLSLNAINDSALTAISGAIGAALKNMAIAASVTVASIDNDTESYIKGAQVDISTGSVSVSAENKAKMLNIAGGVGAGKEGGVGIASAISGIGSDTKAYIENSTITSKDSNISVSAVSQTETETAAAAGGVGGTAGVAGSVAVNNIKTNTDVSVKNSTLDAKGSIKASALSENVINFYGGMIAAAGTAGIGGTVAVNSVSDNAYVNVEDSAIKTLGALSLKDFDGADKSGFLAQSKVDDDINVYSVNIGAAGNVGVAADVSVSNINNNAQTLVKNTNINKAVDAWQSNALQNANITAANYTDIDVYGGSLGIGGTIGAGAVSDTTLINNTAKAIVKDSDIRVKGDLNIITDSLERYNAIVLSGAGAGSAVGIAGNAVVLDIKNDNQALLENSAISINGDVSIKANDNVELGKNNDGPNAIAVGAGALALQGAGIAGAIFVANVKNATKSIVRDSDISAGSIDVLANSVQQVNSYIPTIAAAGIGAGISASIGVVTLDSDTQALVEETSGHQTKLSSDAYKEITIKASSDSSIKNLGATLGAGVVGAGIGASVLISKINGQTSAQVGSGVEISASIIGGKVSVIADNKRAIDDITAAMGAGAVGLSGSVSVATIGGNLSSDDLHSAFDAKSILDKHLSENGNIDGQMLGQDRADILNGTDAQNMEKFTTDVNEAFNTYISQDKSTIASIGANAKITSSILDINAKDFLSINQKSGSGAVGINAMGASVAVANANSSTKALIGNNTVIELYYSNLTLKSESEVQGDSLSTMAAAAFGGALGGAISIFNANNHTESYIGDSVKLTKVSKLDIISKTKSNIHAQTVGVSASLGGVGAGASIANINKSGDTIASTKDNVNIISGGTVNILAETDHTLFSEAESGAGGIVSGSGSDADVNVSGKLWALTGANNVLSASLNVATKGNLSAKSKTYGVNVGGLSIGVSLANILFELDNKAEIGLNNNIDGYSITVAAVQNKADTEISATSAAGALLSGNGAESESEVKGTVSANISKDSKLQGNSISVQSAIYSKQDIKADAYTAGAIGVGVNLAKVKADAKSSVNIDEGVNVNASNIFLAKAVNNSQTYAQSFSGSYGALVGGGAAVNNINNSSSYVGIGKTDKALNLKASKIELISQNNASQDSKTDAVNASIVGATSLNDDNDANINSKIEISGNSNLTANDLKLSASNSYDKSKYDKNLQSTSGGVVQVNVSQSITDINAKADIVINNGAALNTVKKSDGTSSFVSEAFNYIKAKDKLVLTSGGLAMVPVLTSNITNNSDANIKVYDADINTAGDAIFNVKSDADINSAVQISVYGGSAIANGQSKALSNIKNNIDFYNGAVVYAKGDIKLGLTQPYGGIRSNFKNSAITDIYNKTGIPIEGGSEAHGGVFIDNKVNVNSGSVLRSAGAIEINASYAISESQGLLNIYTASDSVTLATKEGATSADIEENSEVAINGSLLSGVNNIFNANISGANGSYTVSGIGLEDVSRSITDENLVTNIIEEIEKYEELAAIYSKDAVLKGAYEAEVVRLKSELEALGLVDENGLVKVVNDVKYITFDNIAANRGEIKITADVLKGNGILSAPGYAEIKINNTSDLFLRINDAVISEDLRGNVIFNGVQVESNADINTVNKNSSANFSSIVTSESDNNPVIEIKNLYSNAGVGSYLELKGDILNRDGNFIAASKGSIYSKGNINALNINIQSDADVIQSYTDGFRHIGGDPSSQWQDIAQGYETGNSTSGNDNSGAKSSEPGIIGNNIFISGRYLNINGSIQSGVADWTLNIANDSLSLEGGFTVTSAIADYNSKIGSNQAAPPLYALSSAHGNINAYYNVLTNEIILDDVSVSGGRLELYGHILNTGGAAGQLTALDGYGKINIVNNSSYNIQAGNIYNDNKVSGIIKITDTAFQKGDAFLVTQYTRDAAGNVIKTQKYSDGSSGSNSSTTSAYKPLSNQRYTWTTGTTSSFTEYYSNSSNSFWGMDFFVPDENSYNYSKGPSETSPIIDGETIIVDAGNSNSYSYGRTGPVTLSQEKTKDRRWTETHGWWIFSTTEYHHELEYRTGTITYNKHSVKADYDIGINFIGYSAPETNISSVNNLNLNGSIMSSAGAVNLISSQGAVNNLGVASVIAKDITISAQAGIGQNLALDARLNGGKITASSNVGDINLVFSNLKDTQGNMYNTVVNGIKALNGNVSIVSDSSIKTDGSSFVKGKNVLLESKYGSLGSISGGLGILNIQADTLTAAAQSDINISDTGDLGIVSVQSFTGDIKLKAVGNVTDANEEAVFDTRTANQLLTDWYGLDLFNQNGAGWTQDQLKYAVNASSLKSTVDTQYQVEDANVLGKNVDIEAGGSIGLNMGYKDINLTNYAALSEADKLLIASAESDNLVFSLDGAGKPVSVRVFETEDLDINADSIKLKANGYVYLGGDQDINVNTIEAGTGQNITIYAKGGIYNVNTSQSAPNLIGNDIVLEAGNGSIGTLSKDLVLNITGKIIARAKDGIYLNAGSKNFLIDSLLSNGFTRLTTSGNITGVSGSLINIVSEGVQLTGANIGTDTQALGITLTQEEAVADAYNALTINSSGKINVAGKGTNTLYTGNIAAAGDVKISAQGDIARQGNTSISGANINFANVGGNIGSSSDKLQVKTSGNVSAASYGGINFTSSENISYNAVSSENGIINLSGTKNLSANNLSAKGNINIVSDKAITTGTSKIASADGSIAISSQEDTTVNGDIEAKEKVEIVSEKALTTTAKITSSDAGISLESAGDTQIDGAITANNEVSIVSKGNIITSAISEIKSTAAGVLL